jgi:hypothetical protein
MSGVILTLSAQLQGLLLLLLPLEQWGLLQLPRG